MKIICGMHQKGIWWLRVLGIGLSWKDIRLHPLMFSERSGYRKGLRLGWWIFHFLPFIGSNMKCAVMSGERIIMWSIFKKKVDHDELLFDYMTKVKDAEYESNRPKGAKLEFLQKLYPALMEFEEATGVKINSIVIHRDLLTDGSATNFTYDIDLK